VPGCTLPSLPARRMGHIQLFGGYAHRPSHFFNRTTMTT
jgi:hypothetical protein